MTNNACLISLECPGSINLDFSSTFYGMMNPLLCESKYMNFLSGFEAPVQDLGKAKQENSGSGLSVDILLVNFYTHLKNGSGKKAAVLYRKLLNAIIEEASLKAGNAENRPDDEALRASAKKLIEEKLGIDIDEEFKKCADRKPVYQSERKSSAAAGLRSSKYMTAEKKTEKSIAAQRALEAGHKFLAGGTMFELREKTISLFEMAEASFLGSPQFLGISVLAVWFSIIFCQLQD